MAPRGRMTHVPVFFQKLMAEYGPVVHWQLGRRHFFVLNEPAVVEELLVSQSRAFVKGRGVERLSRLLGQGLLNSNGGFHLRQRRLVQPAFHRERIARYAQTMIAATEQFAGSLTPGASFAMDKAMHRLTLTIAAETLFGTNIADDADEIDAALTSAMEAFPAAMSPVGELLDRFPILPVTRRFNDARRRLDRVIYRIIAERRASGDDRGDLLAMLFAASDTDGSVMSDEQVRDEAMTMFLAGHETTANALAWTWYLLAQHPAVDATLHAEIDAVLGGRLPQPDDVPALRITRDIVAESMRLYPPAWVIGRRAVAPATLGGIAIPEGAICIASQLAMHRNPRFWREPDAFRPERWRNGETDGLPKFAYFPFSGGNRLCIGESFAWTEAVLVLATLARRFRFTLDDPTPVPMEPLVTLRPGRPMRMRPNGRPTVQRG